MWLPEFLTGLEEKSLAQDEPPADTWDERLAEDLIGRLILIGCTHLDPTGEVVAQEQMFGTVSAADRQHGVEVALKGSRKGTVWRMPPDLRGVSSAAPGVYRLRSTGESVENPDYLVSWTIEAGPDS